MSSHLPDLPTRIAQFRASYPIASLISELLTVQHNLYVVRAIVRINETTIATGLAAAPDIETAEDRARLRALETLILPASTASSVVDSAVSVTTSSPANSAASPITETVSSQTANPSTHPTAKAISISAISESPSVSPATSDFPSPTFETAPIAPPSLEPPTSTIPPASETELAPVLPDEELFYSPPSMPKDALEDSPEELFGSPYSDSEASALADWDAPLPAAPLEPDFDLTSLLQPAAESDSSLASSYLADIPEEPPSVPTSLPLDADLPTSQPLSKRKTPSTDPAFLSSPTPLPSGEIDRSEEIARIGVEMKRLGWDTKQGRDHLQRTYGKRSRQELNDEELLDFLRYLELQPSASQAPF